MTAKDLASVNVGEGFGNNFTGNLDYARQRQLQQRNMDYQERLSNTAYQRAGKDLKKAGFNPALMLTGAKPASTPSSAQSASGGAGRGWIDTIKAVSGMVTSAIKAS